MVFDQAVSMDALIVQKRDWYSGVRYNQVTVTAKVIFFSLKLGENQNFIIFSKGKDYTWSQCTTDGTGAPFVTDGDSLVLRFPFPDATSIDEIELAFNHPDVVNFAEIKFENAHIGKP